MQVSFRPYNPNNSYRQNFTAKELKNTDEVAKYIIDVAKKVVDNKLPEVIKTDMKETIKLTTDKVSSIALIKGLKSLNLIE